MAITNGQYKWKESIRLTVVIPTLVGPVFIEGDDLDCFVFAEIIKNAAVVTDRKDKSVFKLKNRNYILLQAAKVINS